MPCDTRKLPNQSFSDRKVEIKSAVDKLSQALAAGRVKPVIGRQGGIAFPGWAEGQQARVTDSCALRLILSSGTALARQAIARAEAIAGRSVDKHATEHMHGNHWHDGH